MPEGSQLSKVVKQTMLEHEGEGDLKEPVPPDGGWGWMVASGAFLIQMLLPLMNSCFGILYSHQFGEWRTSYTTVTVIFSTYRITWKLSGVVVGALTREFGFRPVAMVGALLISASFTLSAFVTSPGIFFLCFSLGCGVGAGLSTVGFLILAQYFDKQLGLANTVLTAGSGLSLFVSPLLIRYLQVEYGFTGAIVITGAFSLHGVLGSCLFHPVKWHRKCPKNLHTNPASGGVSLSVPDSKNNLLSHEENVLCVDSVAKVEESSRNSGYSEISLEKVGLENAASEPLKSNTTSSKISSLSNSKSALDITKESPSVATSADRKFSTTMKLRTSAMASQLWNSTLNVVHFIAKDLSILKQPAALIIAVGTAITINAQSNFALIVPFAVVAKGHSLQTAAWCVSIAGICNLITRLVVSPLSDCSWFRMKLFYNTSIAVMATAAVVFTLQTEEVLQAVVMGVWGCSCGVHLGLNNLYMTRIVGLHNLTSMFTARNFTIAFSFITIGPLIGVVRDVSSSYTVSMWVLSCLMLVSLVLWLLMPSAVAYEHRKKDKLAQKEKWPDV